jgi:hypothetical protein
LSGGVEVEAEAKMASVAVVTAKGADEEDAMEKHLLESSSS